MQQKYVSEGGQFGRLTAVLLVLGSLGTVALGLMGRFTLGISEDTRSAAFATYQQQSLSIFFTYYGLMLVGLLFIVLAPLLYLSLAHTRTPWLLIGAVCQVLAGLMQSLSASRWLIVFPVLVHASVSSRPDAATLAALDVAYQSISYFLGITLGEHFYLLFTGGWSLFLAISLLSEPGRKRWVGWLGIVAGSCLLLASVEQLDFGFASIFTLFIQAGTLTWLIWTISLAFLLLTNKRNIMKPDLQRENEMNAAVPQKQR